MRNSNSDKNENLQLYGAFETNIKIVTVVIPMRSQGLHSWAMILT